LSLLDAPDSQTDVAGMIHVVRVEGRAAVRAERLGAAGAAVGRFHVHDGSTAEHHELLVRGWDGYAIGGPGQLLAVRAMANDNAFGVDVGFVRERAAMALSSDIHGGRTAKSAPTTPSLLASLLGVVLDPAAIVAPAADKAATADR
jgi:hypothetical protein